VASRIRCRYVVSDRNETPVWNLSEKFGIELCVDEWCT
jgi:hypothetical protein